MQGGQSLHHAALTAHGHHLQDRLLGAVVAVFGASLALGNPDVVGFLSDDVVHIFGEPFARCQHLPDAGTTLNDKRFVHPHQVLDPGGGQQVVADGNLAGCVESVLDEHDIEQCRVEHNVAVVAHKGVTLAFVYGISVDVATLARLLQQFFQEHVAEGFLKLQVALALAHPGSECLERHLREDVRHDGLELTVGQQAFEHLGELFGLKGSDRVKNRWRKHSKQ